MPIKELFFLFYNSVNLLVERQKLLRVHVLRAPTMALREAASHPLAVVGARPECILQVVPILLLLLLQLLLFRHHFGSQLIVRGGLGLSAGLLGLSPLVAPLEPLLLFLLRGRSTGASAVRDRLLL